MSEETLYVSMKIKDMPINPIPSVKMICSGGCGDMVWVDKRLESIWAKVDVVCLECSLVKMNSSMEEISFRVLPESIDSLMQFHIERNKSA